MSKVELYAAIRRDHRGGMKMRKIERKCSVSWRTVRKAVDSVWPEPRKKLPPSRLRQIVDPAYTELRIRLRLVPSRTM
jgi:hypothetical protein